MRAKHRLVRPALKTMRLHTSLFDPNMGGLVPSYVELYNFRKMVLFCPLCKQVYDERKFPYDYCSNCKTELDFYRGPHYLDIKLDKENFVAESTRTGTLLFTSVSEYEDIPSVNYTVLMTLSWPALMRGFRERGHYTGFAQVDPSTSNKYANRDMTAILLTPFQAAFHERWSVVEQGYNRNMSKLKRYRHENTVVPKTFTDMYEVGAFKPEKEDIEEFMKFFRITRSQFNRHKDKYIFETLS